jgi:preprotein translocase subunit Sss1
MAEKVAKLFGAVFILVGVLGFFVPSNMGMGTTLMLNTFPVNAVHNIVHIAIGLWGIAASRSMAGSISFCKLAGLLYLVLGILGFFAAVTDQLNGFVPLGGNDVYLHLALGLILAYFGFMGTSTRTATA